MQGSVKKLIFLMSVMTVKYSIIFYNVEKDDLQFAALSFHLMSS